MIRFPLSGMEPDEPDPGLGGPGEVEPGLGGPGEVEPDEPDPGLGEPRRIGDQGRGPGEATATGLALVDGLATLDRATIDDYCAASAEYIRGVSDLTTGQSKAAQIRLSGALASVTLLDLQDLGLDLAGAVAGEHLVGGGLRPVQADVSQMTAIDGLTLAVELKPVHLAVGRAIWNRFGDIRTFAVNVHLKFPFAVLGGVMSLPRAERVRSGIDSAWKPTDHLIERVVTRLTRAGGRRTEGDAAHLLEGIAVVVFDHESGSLDRSVPPPGSGLRWDEFTVALATAYEARFGAY